MSDPRQTLVERFAPSGGQLGLFLGLFFGTLVVSLAVAGFLLVRAPADYFAGAKPPPLPGPRWVRLGLRVLKNLLGVGIILLGLLVHGVPAGLLTMLVGPPIDGRGSGGWSGSSGCRGAQGSQCCGVREGAARGPAGDPAPKSN